VTLRIDLAKSDTSRDAMNGRFQPVNDDHAIEQVVFALAFSRPFQGPDLDVFRQAHFQWAEALPAIREPAGFAIVVDAGKGVRAQNAPGVEFAFMRPDGTPVWAFRVFGNEIVVECSRYSRWARIWGAASKYLNLAFELVAGLETPANLTGVTHLVQDSFVAPLTDQDVSQLFVRSDLLPNAIFERNADWHSHTGWFADATNLRVLHNLNVDATSDQAASAARISVTHLMTVSGESVPGEGAAAQAAWLEETMTLLHAENKTLMAKLLDPRVLERIGLSQ
jgi:hypothetical protein